MLLGRNSCTGFPESDLRAVENALSKGEHCLVPDGLPVARLRAYGNQTYTATRLGDRLDVSMIS